MAGPPPLALAAILGPSTSVTRRAEIYEADGITPWATLPQPGITAGSVNIDLSRAERRTFDLTLDNTDGSLRHYPGGFWYDKVIKLFRGVSYVEDGERKTWEAQLGEFVIDQIREPHFPKVIQVSGRDYTKHLTTSKFARTTSFAAGDPVENIIKAIAQGAGISKFILPNRPDKVTGRAFLFERGVERGAAIKEIASAYNYDAFFDAQGFLVQAPFHDPVSSPIAWTFETGRFGNIVSYTKTTTDSRIYNHVVVTGEAADQIPVSAEALNLEPSSPTRIRQPGETGGLGDRLYQFTSSFISTKAQAQEVADSFLKVHALEEFNIDLASIVLPWLTVGEVMEFIDPDPAPGDPTRFLLSTLNIPLMLGSMDVLGRRVTLVG